MIVYGEDEGIDPDSGGSVTGYFACLRPRGRPVAIGQTASDGGEYPGNVEMERLRVAGTFVTDESARGFASAAACGKYDPGPDCNTVVKYWLKVADVASRRTVKVPLPGAVSALGLSSTGAVAWVAPTPAADPSSPATSTLYAIVAHPAGRGPLSVHVTVIDQGQAITSVSFSGPALRWRTDGQSRQKTIS